MAKIPSKEAWVSFLREIVSDVISPLSPHDVYGVLNSVLNETCSRMHSGPRMVPIISFPQPGASGPPGDLEVV